MNCADFLNELTDYLDGVIDDRTKAELEDIWLGATTATSSAIPPRRPSRSIAIPSFTNSPKISEPGFARPSWPSANRTRNPAPERLPIRINL